MATSKVVYGGTVLMDLTADTVTASKLWRGVTAHDAAGNQVTGTMGEVMFASGDMIACPTAAASIDGETLSIAGERASVSGTVLQLL